MARVAGVGSNPTIRAFYLRLRTNGKHAKPALTACMRKFLVILNAMLHNKTHWQVPAPTSPSFLLSPLLGAVSEHGCARFIEQELTANLTPLILDSLDVGRKTRQFSVVCNKACIELSAMAALSSLAANGASDLFN
jgi:hypothetical protein